MKPSQHQTYWVKHSFSYLTSRAECLLCATYTSHSRFYSGQDGHSTSYFMKLTDGGKDNQRTIIARAHRHGQSASKCSRRGKGDAQGRFPVRGLFKLKPEEWKVTKGMCIRAQGWEVKDAVAEEGVIPARRRKHTQDIYLGSNPCSRVPLGK